MLFRTALIAATLLITPAYAETKAHGQDSIELKKLADNLHVLITEQGGNVTISTGEDGTFIIDDQLKGREHVVTDNIKKITDKPIKFILNTHYHFDHTGGNETFGAQNAIIVAHDNVRERLSTDQFITRFNKKLPSLSRPGLPVVTFANNMTLNYNNSTAKIMHLPNAHTDGDSIAHFTKENVIVAGDTIFNSMYPFIDTEHGGSIQGMIKAMDAILDLSNETTTIIPGHGAPMNKAELKALQKTLTEISNNVETLIQDGKTLKEITAAKPTQTFDAKMGGGFIPPDAFVSILYDSLAKKN